MLRICPLGSAAGYGVPLGIDRDLTARLLGFSGPVRNVLYASNARGKCESVILSAAAQVMLTLSRAAEDLILYSMPEFGYFSFPPEFGTGSSIMPQKNNPDVLELVRARCFRVQSCASTVAHTVSELALTTATITKATPVRRNSRLTSCASEMCRRAQA